MPAAPKRATSLHRLIVASVRAGCALAERAREFDWPLIVILLGFLAVAPILGGVGSLLTGAMRWIAPSIILTPMEAYEESIGVAAVKTPEFSKPLQEVNVSKPMQFVRFREKGGFETKGRKAPIWVALPEELHSKCKGAGDPARALQHWLGLPPLKTANYVVTPIEIPVAGLSGVFRPCFSGGELARTSCDLPRVNDVPRQNPFPAPAANGAQKTAAELTDELKALRSEHERLHFIANHMWESYQSGLVQRNGKPNFGYPFTGMGLTYNWNMRAPGVSEFIVGPDVEIKIGADVSPADFCK